MPIVASSTKNETVITVERYEKHEGNGYEVSIKQKNLTCEFCCIFALGELEEILSNTVEQRNSDGKSVICWNFPFVVFKDQDGEDCWWFGNGGNSSRWVVRRNVQQVDEFCDAVREILSQLKRPGDRH